MNAPDLRRISPSLPGARFSSADLAGVRLAPDDLSRIIMGLPVPGVTDNPKSPWFQTPENKDPTLVLLAQLAKDQKKANAEFYPATFNFGTYTQQQLFGANPNRNYLVIQNVGSGDICVVFETGPIKAQDCSNDTTTITSKQTRAIRIVAGGYYEPLVAPRNAITLFSINTATNGVAIEGNG